MLWPCPAWVCHGRRPRFYEHHISHLYGCAMSVWSSLVACEMWTVTAMGISLRWVSRLRTSRYLLYRNTDAKRLSPLAQTPELEPRWLRICILIECFADMIRWYNLLDRQMSTYFADWIYWPNVLTSCLFTYLLDASFVVTQFVDIIRYQNLLT